MKDQRRWALVRCEVLLVFTKAELCDKHGSILTSLSLRPITPYRSLHNPDPPTRNFLYLSHQHCITAYFLMPKRAVTPPPGDDEPRYLTVVHPYPLNAHMELPEDRENFGRWLACCIGPDPFYAFFHKPSVCHRFHFVISFWSCHRSSN
jgi:hypothetical protein